MSDSSIVRDGALVGDGYSAFEHSALDQSVFYPADMSGLPTSTPNPANLRRKSRRSWFETTPKGFKFDIAVEKPVVSKKPSRKSDTIEVLTLTHFSGAPRLGFGTLKVGQEKTCTLLLRNPHDYEQSVKVEKVPEKKNFFVSCKQFSVGAGESYPLEITWSPKEAGGCREMVMMQVDGAYRVQAYVFGTSTAPPPQKKKGKRVGLLASKATGPFSVIHTTSLANINQQYSPEKHTGKQSAKQIVDQKLSQLSRQPVSRSVKPGTQFKGLGKHTQLRVQKHCNGLTEKGRRSSEGRRRSPRLSDKYQSVSKESLPTTRQSEENLENIIPDTLTGQERVDDKTKKRKSSERKTSLPKPKIGENIPRKKMRRSNTYSQVSGLGLVVPIIQGDSVKGLKDTSLLNIEDCDISGIKVLEDSVKEVENGDVEPSFLEPKEEPCIGRTLKDKTHMLEPSFLDDGNTMLKDHNDSINLSLIKDKTTKLKSKAISDTLEPSFLECKVTHVTKSSVFNAVQNCETFHDSLEVENQSVDDPSFLQLENKKPDRPRRSLRKRSGIIDVENNDKPTGVKLLRGAKRNNARKIISPETFIKDNCPKTESRFESLVDEHKPLNDSVGQSTLLEQLKSLKSFVHDRSVEIEKSGNGSICDIEDHESVKELQSRETFIKLRTSPRFSVPGNDINLRRGTFVTESTKLKLLETQEPSEASPRRTTFTVMKASTNSRKPKESKMKDGDFALTEEEELDIETEQKTNDIHIAVNVNEQILNDDVQKQSGRLFSADSLEDDSFEKQTKSPEKIFVEPKEEWARRATLTVTKSRPSDALLEHARKSAAAMKCLSDSSALKPEEVIPEDEVETDRLTETEDKLSQQKSSSNSTFEVPLENSIVVAKDSSFPTTPYHLLPTSPHLDHSRRSTHIVEKPKVVNLSKVSGKQLFAKQTDSDLENYDGIEVEQKGESDDVVELNSQDGINSKLQEQNEVEKRYCVDEEIRVEKSETCENNTGGNEGPSSNLRRRKLSVRRSVPGPAQQSSEKLNESPNVTGEEMCRDNTNEGISVEKGNKDLIDGKMDGDTQSAATEQLFFVPFDNKSESEESAKPRTKRPDPNQFLKKRSNPITQEDDRRSKRPKSEMTIKKKEVVARGGSKLGQTVNVTKVKESVAPQGRVTRQTVKSVVIGTARNTTSRQGLKPTGTIKGLATSKLILTKKTKSAIPKHPLPFAARNMFYDERWMEKQERGFVNWLNFILTPPEEHQGSDVKVKVDAGKLTLDIEKGRTRLAPTNEILSFRTYSAHRKLNRLRKSACRLFQSESVRRVIQKVEEEVENKRLLVRKDKMLHADVGAKQKVLDMLLSYNPLWLRMGLETIYGEVVPLQCNTDVYGLSQFIVVRVLASPDIADEYAHPTVPHLYRDGYAEATAQHTLKRFLMLVYFLDQAKQHTLIDHNPCLFCKNSDIKTSKDMLLQFSRDYLSGEGDITRHLGYLGYRVTYSQTALDEFDFAVKSLGTDLRDGLRLARVMEVICDKAELRKSLRAPAISRLQKIHNLEVVFKTLEQQSIDTGNVTTRDVVDGHREKTLSLLWTIILHYQVAMVINVEQIKEEVQILERSLRLKKQLHKLINLQTDVTSQRRESEGPDLHTQDERLNLLMKWCRAVCAFYDIKVENFTVSFSDGRALCHILHYYHPGLLPLSHIKHETSMTHLESMEKNCQQNMNCSLNDSVNSSAVFGDVADPAVYEQLLANEKENFKLLSEKVKELGGIPLMLRWSDMSNTIPDEKVVVTYLMYLCARLLDIRHESRAARVIQHAWRVHRLRKIQAEYEVKGKAVLVIQRAVRRFLQSRRQKHQQAAALCIQKVWRGHQARSEARKLRREKILQQQMHAVRIVQSAVKRYIHRRRYLEMKTAVIQVQAYCRGYLVRRKRHTAATNIQRVYRGHLARQQVKLMQHAANKIQAAIRGFLARKLLKKQVSAARTIQCRYRAYLEMRKQQGVYHSTRKACTVVQKCWRRQLALKREKQEKAAVKIQACFRCYSDRKRYQKLKDNAVCIQAAFRGCIQRREFERRKRAVLLLQRRFRDCLVTRQQRQTFLKTKEVVLWMQSKRRMIVQRQKYLVLSDSATRLQAYARMLIQRRNFQKLKSSAVTLQRYYRALSLGRAFRKNFLVSKGAAITIQAAFRGYRVRREVRKCTSAAVVIQSNVRCYIARCRFLALKTAAIVCQQRYRAKISCRNESDNYTKLKNAALVVQKMFRGLKSRRVYVRDRNDVVKVQSVVRMYLRRKQFMKMKKAVSTLQVRYRANQLGRSCRHQFLVTVGATITLQAGVRGFICRKQYKEMRQQVIQTQAAVRGHLQYRRYQNLKQSTILIQKRFRETLIARRQRSDFVQMKKAAVVLQSAWRMRKEKSIYLKRRFLFHKNVRSAIKIQAVVRGYLQRQQYQKTQSALITIQRRMRETLLSRQQRRDFLRRNCLLSRNIMSRTVGERCRRQFLLTVGAVISIQAWFRGHQVRKQLKLETKSAIVIQSVFRGYCQQRQYMQLKRAAVVCQRRYKAISWGLAITMQAYARMYIIRKLFLQTMAARKNSAAVRIQACVRRYLAVQKFDRLKSAVVTCQRKYRAKCCGQQDRQYYVERKNLLLKYNPFPFPAMQRVYKRVFKQSASPTVVARVKKRSGDHIRLVRTWLARRDRAARVIQRVARQWLATADTRKQHAAAVKIQALWKGYHKRKSIKNRRLTLLRKRVQETSASATEENKLGNRTSSALDFLLRYKQLSQVLDALQHLEVASRLSWICCERMVEAIPVLYRLVQGCNRSLPHMEIIKYTISILTNLSKYEKTRPAVYEAEGGVNILVNLMQIYREKGQIFSRTCTLLGILALETPCKMSILEDVKLVERLRSIQMLTSRKHKLEVNQRVTRARMNASSLNATFMVRSPVKRQKIKPDWSLHKDKMNEIENPLKAINFVLGNLGIQANNR
ncbi:abnormal spindle-like microcephaly-associated protein homolog [Mercenaria mercenaria]|uniref:abnormal spindle-like microcephaly-associated protein homolog n=1 Tax=Mercenaria mercenaria TaxID=6596 RepID=UPI00234E77B2|nr:abnormal spindle-like microcephaly-associated protein homolog [Mercenaria mercenaria]